MRRVLVDCCNPVFTIVHPLKKKPNICRWNFDKGTELPLDNSIDQAMRNVKQITFTYYIVMRFGLIFGLLESLSPPVL